MTFYLIVRLAYFGWVFWPVLVLAKSGSRADMHVYLITDCVQGCLLLFVGWWMVVCLSVGVVGGRVVLR